MESIFKLIKFGILQEVMFGIVADDVFVYILRVGIGLFGSLKAFYLGFFRR